MANRELLTANSLRSLVSLLSNSNCIELVIRVESRFKCNTNYILNMSDKPIQKQAMNKLFFKKINNKFVNPARSTGVALFAGTELIPQLWLFGLHLYSAHC